MRLELGIVLVAFGLISGEVLGAQSVSGPWSRDGRPDLSGVWIAGGFAIDGDKPAPPPPSGSAPIRRDPPPYKPEAGAKMKELASNNANDPAVHCFLLGVPRSNTWPFPLEIVQTPQKVVILYEAMRVYRIIPIGGKHPEPNDLDPSFMGTAVGRWEGDTLVVETIGFNDKTWLGPPGSNHSDQLRVPSVTAWDRRTRSDTRRWPKIPWCSPGHGPLRRSITAISRMPTSVSVEYECLEDNQDVQHLVPSAVR